MAAATKRSLLLALAAASLLLALPTASAQCSNSSPYIHNPAVPADYYVLPLETTPPNDCTATTVAAKFTYWVPLATVVSTTFSSQPFNSTGANLISTNQLASPTFSPASGSQREWPAWRWRLRFLRAFLICCHTL